MPRKRLRMGLGSPLFCRRAQPCAEPSRDHQSQHAEVADERPEGMAEGGRRVFLQQEVAGPGETVTQRNPEQRIPRMMRRESHDRNNEAQRGSDGVHPAISRVTVLLQIKSEELVVGTECSRLRHVTLRLTRW